jgi:uncharacterized membrane protein YphA (DoxX/SURF4 family)
MLASIFIAGGVDALRNPGSKAPAAEEVAPRIASYIPALEGADTETLVRINAGVQIGAGSLLALGRFPRLASLALAASVVPTTAAGHRFWEVDDQLQRAQQRTHFLKNVSILGGLLIAAADTEGKPGIGWRTRHTAGHAEAAVDRSKRKVRRAARTAKREAKLTAAAASAVAKAKLPG